MRQAAGSLTYVAVPIAAQVAGAAVDPTADVVQMAFPPVGSSPQSSDWQAATWSTDPTTNPPTYYAQCLVGPGGAIELSQRTYDVWVRVSDSPEIPALLAGRLVIF